MGGGTMSRQRLAVATVKRVLLVVAAGGLLLAVLTWQAWRSYERFLVEPLDLTAAGATLIVDQGMSGRAVVSRLAGQGLTRPGWRWRLLLRLEPTVMKAGEYRLEPGMTPPDLLGKLARGEVIQYRFTIVEGWTLQQLLAALAADPLLGEAMPAAESRAWLEALVPDHANPEGWFLPETYLYTRGDSYLDVLRRSHQAMRNALDHAWGARVADHPAATPYELLVLASIIEKETALDEERGDVSGVFVRRLQKGMRLQTDPTVIYGLGTGFDGDIRNRDLTTDSPYNTYTRPGLPPTPIALPGRASLLAAARPAPGDALYFVADGSGGHTFSATLEEHQKAVKQLLERQP